MAHVDSHNSNREAVWFLDSGCSNHMTRNKHWFLHLDQTFRQAVKLGNDAKMTMMGKGSIKLQVNGANMVITDVFYIHVLKNNLLSIGQLQEKNLSIVIQHGECKIYHSKMVLIMQT